jgi:hypothetical protein
MINSLPASRLFDSPVPASRLPLSCLLEAACWLLAGCEPILFSPELVQALLSALPLSLRGVMNESNSIVFDESRRAAVLRSNHLNIVKYFKAFK